MIYRVTKKYARGPESPVGTYKNLNDARKVIQDKLADDAAHRVIASYCLYEGFDLIEELDQSALKVTERDQGQGESSGQGKSSTQSFRPTPFSTTPMPKGTPRSFIVDEDDKKDEK